jgi:thermitase
VSLSWGSETASSLLEAAVGYADSKGLILVAAAGNAPTGQPVYPAAYASVIGVGALAADGQDWNQSNHGDFVSLAAPGMADLPVGYNGDPGRYAGTSIATAYTARQIAAIIDRYPDADRETILTLLKGSK